MPKKFWEKKAKYLGYVSDKHGRITPAFNKWLDAQLLIFAEEGVEVIIRTAKLSVDLNSHLSNGTRIHRAIGQRFPA